jgi:extracellular factor (EF) 3-hydroxypalmitic acid methyl ester biosynthesis protein
MELPLHTSYSEAHMADTNGFNNNFGGTGNDQEGLSRLETLIRDLAAFLPRITELPAREFDAAILAQVKSIDELSWQYPERRELLKKMCFDLCAYALDQSSLLWRIRHKPFGYAGDFETLEMLYTGETHSQGVGKDWDAFVFRQGVMKSVLVRQQLFSDVFTEVCQRKIYQASPQLSVLSIAASARDFLQAIERSPRCAKQSLFYCLEPEAKAITRYKKLLTNVTDVTFMWDSREVENVSLERRFDLIWLPRSLPYLSDERVIALVRKLWALLRSRGVLIIASSQNSDEQILLEWCTGWTLHQRSLEQKKALFLQAGVPGSAIRYDGVGWRLEVL